MDYNLSSYLNNSFSYSLVTPSLDLSIADCDCTIYFLPTTCPCDYKVPVLYGGKRVRIPNGETMVATHTVLLTFSQLPLATQKCDVFQALQKPFLSLGQFLYAGIKAIHNSETIQLTNDGIAKLSGMRDHINGIYFNPLQEYLPSPHSPLPTTDQSALSALTSSSHTLLQSYSSANITLPN